MPHLLVFFARRGCALGRSDPSLRRVGREVVPRQRRALQEDAETEMKGFLLLKVERGGVCSARGGGEGEEVDVERAPDRAEASRVAFGADVVLAFCRDFFRSAPDREGTVKRDVRSVRSVTAPAAFSSFNSAATSACAALRPLKKSARSFLASAGFSLSARPSGRSGSTLGGRVALRAARALVCSWVILTRSRAISLVSS